MTENDLDYVGDGLPAGWAETTLGHAFIWSSGGTPDSNTPTYYGGQIPWVVIGDLTDGVIDHAAQSITEEGLKNSSAKWVKPYSVLLAMYGSIGKLGLASIPLTTNQAIAFTDPHPIEPKYLFYYLMSQRRALNHLGMGATQQNISQTVIKSFPFVIAPLPEQARLVTRIEELTSQIDAGTAGLRDVRQKLKRYHASVLKAACEGTLVPTEADLAQKENRPYEPAHVLLARILTERRARWEADQLEKMRTAGKEPKDDKWKARYGEPAAPDTSGLPPLPEGWTWASAAALSTVVVDCLHSTPNYGQGEFFSVDTTCMEGGRLVVERLRRVDEATFSERNRRLAPQQGDIVFAREGTVGTAVSLPETPKVCLGQRVMLLRPSTFISSKYVEKCLLSSVVRKQYQGKLIGSTVPHVNVGDVVRFAIPLPPFAEQARIVAEVELRLSVIDQMEAALSANLKRADRLRQAVLRDAFAGKLVPQDPSDEPASVLLERIKAEREKAAAGSPRLSARNKP